MAEVLLVVSKVKKKVKEAGYRTGLDYIQALSTKIDSLINESIEKVKVSGNKKTLGAEDL